MERKEEFVYWRKVQTQKHDLGRDITDIGEILVMDFVLNRGLVIVNFRDSLSTLESANERNWIDITIQEDAKITYRLESPKRRKSIVSQIHYR